MSSTPSIHTSADVQWSDDHVHVSIGDEKWTVARESLDTLISLLEAGRSMAAGSVLQVMRREASISHEGNELESPRTSARGKRRSRKRVGDALILWMEEHTGWHHEEVLLQVVIDNRMTDANPLRALKIALGKQRDSIFTEGGHGYWKLSSDETAGALPQPTASPTVRQRILARTRDVQENTSDEVSEPAAMLGEDSESSEAAGGNGDKAERWSDVSNDEVARARRNLLGLGSTN